MSKSYLRNKAKKVLNMIAQPNEKNAVIQNRVMSLPSFQHAQHIGLYLPYKTEVDTLPIIETIFEQNKNCYLPHLTNKTDMEFYPINNYKDIFNYSSNRYGIREPPITEYNIDSLDLIIVPGLGFDWNNNRLGRGKGYYDRYLTRLHYNNVRPLLLGVCYREQMMENIPQDPWDIKMNIVITD